jgi:hypothetical protein
MLMRVLDRPASVERDACCHVQHFGPAVVVVACLYSKALKVASTRPVQAEGLVHPCAVFTV